MYKTIILDCQNTVVVISCDDCIAYKNCEISKNNEKETKDNWLFHPLIVWKLDSIKYFCWKVSFVAFVIAVTLQNCRSNHTHPDDRNSPNYLHRGLLLLPLPKNNPDKRKTIVPSTLQHSQPLQRHIVHTTNPNPTDSHTTPVLLNIASMIAVWTNSSSHTQTTTEKQPKPKKQPNPKLQV
jgi:hypothetical protein